MTTLSITDLLSMLKSTKKTGSGWTALCPAHEDNRNSLSITESDNGKILFHCHAGCTFDSIAAALGIGIKLNDVSNRGEDRLGLGVELVGVAVIGGKNALVRQHLDLVLIPRVDGDTAAVTENLQR